MSDKGWVYLRCVEGQGYCIGKTNNIKRRDQEYRKENPWIKNVDAYEVEDMSAVETELIREIKRRRLSLYPRNRLRNEWMKYKPERVMELWEYVKSGEAGEAARARKREEERRQAAWEESLKPDPLAAAKKLAWQIEKQEKYLKKLEGQTCNWSDLGTIACWNLFFPPCVAFWGFLSFVIAEATNPRARVITFEHALPVLLVVYACVLTGAWAWSVIQNQDDIRKADSVLRNLKAKVSAKSV